MARLATVIEEVRRRAFVGRGLELARFGELLDGAGPWRVMFVHGPGGIGKTALLDEFAVRARSTGRITVGIDLRDVERSPDGLRASFDWAATKAGGEPSVVLLDGYERFGGDDAWIRAEFLPSLAADAIVVLAGQDPPPDPWITDAGWRHVVSVHRLGELDIADSRTLVARAGAPAQQVEELVSLGRGHPLTLALLADAAKSGDVPTDDLADAPDLVARLVARVVGDVPSTAHATGLAVCAHAWLTTEDLLRWAVGDDAAAVYEWLESRSFVARAPHGLYPHALARDALEADLLRRSRETYRRVHRRVHGFAVAGLRRADGFERQLLIHQKMWLHRRSPLSALYLVVRDLGPTALVPGTTADHPAVLAMIERFEGAQSAAIAARWLAAAPHGLHVIRVGGEVVAFAYNIVCPADPALCDADPVVRSILDHVAATSPARPGEKIWIGRFVGGANGDQRDPLAVTAAATAATVEWVTRPLAWSFVPPVDAEFWAPAMDYIAFTQQFTIDDIVPTHTVYGNDWRRFPVDAWLDLLDERELTGESGPPPDAFLKPPPLDRSGFDEAVRAALRDWRRTDRLGANALMRSVVGDGDVDGLRATLSTAIDRLGSERRGEPLVRVLDRTYRHAAPSQEAAAEVLGLPFSTYRRHLVRAVERLTDMLWAVEIGEMRRDELTESC